MIASKLLVENSVLCGVLEEFGYLVVHPDVKFRCICRFQSRILVVTSEETDL